MTIDQRTHIEWRDDLPAVGSKLPSPPLPHPGPEEAAAAVCEPEFLEGLQQTVTETLVYMRPDFPAETPPGAPNTLPKAWSGEPEDG